MYAQAVYHIQGCSCVLYVHAHGCCRSDCCAGRCHHSLGCILLLLSPCRLVGIPGWSDAAVHQSACAPDEAVRPPVERKKNQNKEVALKQTDKMFINKQWLKIEKNQFKFWEFSLVRSTQDTHAACIKTVSSVALFESCQAGAPYISNYLSQLFL